MLELVPERVNDTVVLNIVSKNCPQQKMKCGICSDFNVGIHNWLVTTGLKYVIIDLQDEKEICPVFLEEILQLRKRLKYPFYFTGVMEKPKKILQSYDFDNSLPIFVCPEEAIQIFREHHPDMASFPLDNVQFGSAIVVSGSRQGPRFLGEDDEGEVEEEREEEGDVDNDNESELDSEAENNNDNTFDIDDSDS